MTEDAELLRRYAETRAEEAFAEIVRRRVGLVYSVALRTTGDPHRAEDATQAVFADLARKAAALADRPVVAGWLYRSAHYAALGLMRAERHRAAREKEAHLMQEILGTENTAAEWERVRPVLDAAMSQLTDSDRDAIALRFFDGRPFAEIGTQLKLTENSARMRVERALDKLHALLARRGIRSTAAALSAVLAHEALGAAPAGLAASVTCSALASANAGVWSLAFFKFMATSKIATSGATALLLLAVGTAGYRIYAGRKPEAATAASSVPRAADPKLPSSLIASNQSTNPRAASLPTQSQMSPALAAEQWKRFLDTTPVPEPLTGPGQVAWMVPVARWNNVGRKTVGSAVQSQYWAISQGDIDYLRGAIVLDERARRSLPVLLDQVSASIRAEYSTPESLAAFLLASQPVLNGYALSLIKMGASTDDDEVVLHLVAFELGADRGKGEAQHFSRSPDGEWLRVIGAPEVTKWGEMIKWDAELSKSRKWPTKKG
jgi:RNA polymerase sigma factor (sigma-70 family)